MEELRQEMNDEFKESNIAADTIILTGAATTGVSLLVAATPAIKCVRGFGVGLMILGAGMKYYISRMNELSNSKKSEESGTDDTTDDNIADNGSEPEA